MQLLDPDHQPCLFPQAFQIVVVAQFRVKDMYDDRAKVDQDPARFRAPFDVQAASAHSTGPIFDLGENGPELWFAFGIAQDKKVGQQRHLRHIQNDDVGAESFGYGIHDHMSKLNWFQNSSSKKMGFIGYSSFRRSASSRSSICCQWLPRQ